MSEKSQNISFRYFNPTPTELTDHMFAAFAHKAGSGPDPGKYTGPQPDFEKALLELEDEDPYVSEEEKDDAI